MEAKAFADLDKRVRNIEIATGDIPKRVDKHDEQILELLLFRSKVLAFAAAGGIVGGVVASVITALIERH